MMKKIWILFIFSITALFGDISLKNKEKTLNLEVNTIDTQAILDATQKMTKQINFKTLKDENNGLYNHLERIKLTNDSIKQLVKYRSELELNSIEIKTIRLELDRAGLEYDKEINKIYRNNDHIERDSYILVAYPDGVPYEAELEEYLVEKFAIKKYDQSTTLKKTLENADMENIIKTEKDFGQKSVDTEYEYIIRANNTIFKLFKIKQNPFVKSKAKTITTELAEIATLTKNPNLLMIDMAGIDYTILKNTFIEKYNISTEALQPFISALQIKIDQRSYSENFTQQSQKIADVLKKLDQVHNLNAKKILTLKGKLDGKIEHNKLIEPLLESTLKNTQELLKPYEIPLTKETIGNVTLLEPKIYTESVYLGEEDEFITRKVKNFISALNVTELQKSETLINFSDLSGTTKKKHKDIKYETIHLLPYLAKGNKIGVLIFGSISLKDEVSDADLVHFDFKYNKLSFVPIKQGYKTLFVSQSELPLGIVKEFLEVNKPSKYFDQHCIDDSFLPEEAKDFKNISSEYYDYPAVCFKIDEVGGFINWLSNKTNREIVIPSVKDWAYVASNGDTTDFCWGNQTPKELEREDILPENIAIKTNTKNTIEKINQFPKSQSGVFDMCGNVFEIAMEGDEVRYKGNSFSSYIEYSRDKAERYTDGINPNLGLRPFYIKDIINE